MVKKPINSDCTLTAKRYILNDKPVAVGKAIEGQITAGNRILSKFRQNAATTGLSEYVLRNFLVEFKSWNQYNISLLKTLFIDADIPKDYEDVGGLKITYSGIGDRADKLDWDCVQKIAYLQTLKDQIPLFDKASKLSTGGQATPTSFGNKVFIVHGHDDGVKQKVARFLEKGLGLEVIILHEQPNQGKTVIEKLEKHSSEVDIGYAVVILTPDDIGKLASETCNPSPRARQNVIFELGYFIGKLGREKVCALLLGEMERPTDYGGVIYIPLDHEDAWQLKIAKELNAAHIKIDPRKTSELANIYIIEIFGRLPRCGELACQIGLTVPLIASFS